MWGFHGRSAYVGRTGRRPPTGGPSVSEDTTQDRAGLGTRARIDTTEPHSARFWNHFVGGEDHYEVDREVGDQIKDVFPGPNDPVVLTHADALLTSTPEGGTAYLDADPHDPEAVLRAAAGTPGPSRPVALMIL
ncbi:hypothetical protein GCM10010266_01370 [Streptomyces griseomycini]|nr:hypothetical protein GCM10010266_01370 [Streptomyces griseomycini]GGR03426.1 hypothetical protein GCM10015536_05600 [Streptomyces griseomycini]